jgi:hypothetical protein
MKRLLTTLALCFCGLPAFAGPAPTVDAVQAAYENAKVDAVGRHDDKLVIREADCEEAKDGQFTCQVGFTNGANKSDRLYFDVIGLDRRASGFVLVSGLCRR